MKILNPTSNKDYRARRATIKDSHRVKSFGGKTDNFIDKDEKRFEQAHLKAYLKGATEFKYKNKLNTITGDYYHPVLIIWK